MKRLLTLAAVMIIPGALAACSTTRGSSPEAHLPPANNYDVRIQPVRIPPNPQGAFALSTATGCDIIFVAKTATADTVTYAVRPTSRMPDAAQCASRLAQQPGVESVAAAR